MAVNVVVYNGNTLVDLSEDTVTPETLAEGVTAHDKSGNVIVGTMTGGGGEYNQLHELLDRSIVEIDSPVTVVKPYSCYDAISLKTVNLPNVTDIDNYGFRGCASMTRFNAPNTITIGNYAFYNCRNMTEFNFPSVISVGNSAFYLCQQMLKIDFGVLESIGNSTFVNCKKIESVILRNPNTVVTLGTTVFSNTNATFHIYVPAALIDSYKVAANWSTYADQFRAIEDYPDICG